MIRTERKWETKQSHAETVLVELAAALREYGASLDRMDYLVAVHGPGSFTGIRIGLGTIMGFAEAFSKPIYLINSLEATAMACIDPDKEFQVALDARRNQVYIQSFRYAGNLMVVLNQPLCITVERWIESLIPSLETILGDGALKYKTEIIRRHPGADVRPGPVNLASAAGQLAFFRLEAGSINPTEIPEALYLRPPDVLAKAETGI